VAADETDVAIVGAGITGLATAYRLERLAADVGRRLRVRVFEAAGRVGGWIETERRDGFTMERGADSIVTDKPWGIALCRELGLEEHVLPTRAGFRGSFIARGRRLRRVPEGFHLMAPSRLWPFVASGLLSPLGTLRVAADLVIPRRTDGGEESLAGFVRRRLGREALERIAQPMVGGIYTADPEKLSLAATMPRFVEMERRHGSLIRAMIASRRESSAIGSASGPRYELFVSLREGMEELPRRLAARLSPGTLELGTPVTRIARVARGWQLATARGVVGAQAVCVTVPAHAAAALLEDAAPRLARELGAIAYASSITVNLVFDRSAISHPLDGFGFVVPAVEGRATIGCSFSSVKYEDRAPAGSVLLRAFVGGALAPDAIDRDDAALVEAVLGDLRDLLAVRGEPRDVLVSRLPQSMPQYHLGHLDRVARVEAETGRQPGLFVAGAAYRGTGIPDCIHAGEEAARSVLAMLEARPTPALRAAAESRA
jgi:oxygen-dependent protoporphyrinogen oxidase